MRPDRKPVDNPARPHSLVKAQPGVNRNKPGEYECSCGQTFTGINAYEAHRALMRRAETDE